MHAFISRHVFVLFMNGMWFFPSYKYPRTLSQDYRSELNRTRRNFSILSDLIARWLAQTRSATIESLCDGEMTRKLLALSGRKLDFATKFLIMKENSFTTFQSASSRWNRGKFHFNLRQLHEPHTPQHDCNTLSTYNWLEMIKTIKLKTIKLSEKYFNCTNEKLRNISDRRSSAIRISARRAFRFMFSPRRSSIFPNFRLPHSSRAAVFAIGSFTFMLYATLWTCGAGIVIGERAIHVGDFTSRCKKIRKPQNRWIDWAECLSESFTSLCLQTALIRANHQHSWNLYVSNLRNDLPTPMSLPMRIQIHELFQ